MFNNPIYNNINLQKMYTLTLKSLKKDLGRSYKIIAIINSIIAITINAIVHPVLAFLDENLSIWTGTTNRRVTRMIQGNLELIFKNLVQYSNKIKNKLVHVDGKFLIYFSFIIYLFSELVQTNYSIYLIEKNTILYYKKY